MNLLIFNVVLINISVNNDESPTFAKKLTMDSLEVFVLERARFFVALLPCFRRIYNFIRDNVSIRLKQNLQAFSVFTVLIFTDCGNRL